MEIVFLTLFLSVTTTGPRPVQVQAPPGTAAVVFRLDGEQVAGLTGPPWSVVVDFGEELVPHELDLIPEGVRPRPSTPFRKSRRVLSPIVTLSARGAYRNLIGGTNGTPPLLALSGT